MMTKLIYKTLSIVFYAIGFSYAAVGSHYKLENWFEYSVCFTLFSIFWLISDNKTA